MIWSRSRGTIPLAANVAGKFGPQLCIALHDIIQVMIAYLQCIPISIFGKHLEPNLPKNFTFCIASKTCFGFAGRRRTSAVASGQISTCSGCLMCVQPCGNRRTGSFRPRCPDPLSHPTTLQMKRLKEYHVHHPVLLLVNTTVCSLDSPCTCCCIFTRFTL